MTSQALARWIIEDWVAPWNPRDLDATMEHSMGPPPGATLGG